MKYDLEIILPVCSKHKYLERFKNFFRLGLINHQKYNILLNFLVGSESFPKEYFFKFPKNIEPKIIKSKYDHPASKVYEFYANYNDFNQSKWIARLDDDSITDVDLVMSSIEDVDYNKNYFFTAECVEGIIKTSLEILRKNKLLPKLKNRFSHEVEIAIISNNCFKQIVENYREILKERSTMETGYTDQLFCYLCKISGIFPHQLESLTSKFNLNAFINKKVGHIHYVENYENIINVLEEKNSNFIDKEVTIDETKYSLKLKNTGVVSHNKKMPQPIKSKYAFWNYKNNTLFLYDTKLNISKQIRFGSTNIKDENFLRKILKIGKSIFSIDQN